MWREENGKLASGVISLFLRRYEESPRHCAKGSGWAGVPTGSPT